ncbi:MAG: sialate O-acetylesterase [Leadbetterella sp.]
MFKNRPSYPLFILFVFTCQVSFSQLKLPSFFSDGMVLQQKTKASIWGNDKPKAKITLISSWGAKSETTANDSGAWKTAIETPKSGGIYQIEIKGSTSQKIKNILVGEVWFCSGQSNMQMPLKGNPNEHIEGSQEAILNADFPEIRYFIAARSPSLSPKTDIEGKWETLSPATAQNLSAVAYFFGKMLHQTLKSPIGLIISTVGGTGSEAWIDTSTLAKYIDLEPSRKRSSEDLLNKNGPSVLFNGMVAPFLDFDIAGVIWYQGENNRYAKRAFQYRDVFPALIGSWRKQWNQGDFPFYYVQIAPFQGDKGSAALVRESQLLTMKSVNNTGMVVTQDIGNCENIHPPQKREVGERLAYWALAKTYGHSYLTYSGPIYQSMLVEGDKIKIKFDFAEMGLSTYKKELLGFEIAGEDTIFVPANASIIKSKTEIGSILVSSEKVKNPVAVRYAFADCVEGTLFNTFGLPASPFRTDTWEIEVK